MADTHQSGDLEVVISGIVASRAGMTERQRLDVPMRLRMLFSIASPAGPQATADGATYLAGDTPMIKDEFALAIEMAKLRQLDRIADLLEKLSAQLDDRKK